MITLTEHDADSILKMIRSEREALVSNYKCLNDTIKRLISVLGDEGSEELEKYNNEKKDYEKTYYDKLEEYDNAIIILTAGSEIK